MVIQQASHGLHEKAVTLRANRIKKSIDYTKLENPLYVSQNAGEAHNESIRDDALIKHMRNLPDYLQRVEKDENIQGKALNFGVLDWGRLENWKSNEKRIPPRYNMKSNNPTLEGKVSTRFPRNKKKIRPPRRNQQSSNGSPLNSPGVRWPRGKPVNAQLSVSSPCSNDLPSGNKYQTVELECSKGKQVDQMGSLSCNEHLMEANESRPSNCFSAGEFESLSPFRDVPHSCPFPLPLTAELECPNKTPVTPLRGSSLKENIDEQPALKGRQPSSPNRRFSFSLGKMARSFSFKESSSSIPRLSPSYISVKSGPVKFPDSPDLVNHNWKNSNSTNVPSRSSPLRRFLDPLLKLKGSHLTEKVHKLKLDINPTNAGLINESELLHNKKHRSCNVQALLQLTLKNGIPFFKLVVESSSDILAAAVKKLPSGKDDSSLIYAFYSVHETKKKVGSWMYQSSKEKSYHFGYNIIGQMKISSSYHAEFSGAEKDLYVVRESVLYSTHNQKTPDCMLNGELAAIIVKNPSDITCGDIGSSKSTVVVIPEGIHSWPNNGLPSPLINRWRCGGACDCGGWDIGCQFHVLNHQNEIVKTSTPSDRLDLSFQVGHKNKCSFRLVSLEDGLYTLEYDPSMSLLQAFSICVAVVSSQKLTHIFQVNYVPESKDMSKPIPTNDEKVKSQKEYVSKPPASPVGRV